MTFMSEVCVSVKVVFVTDRCFTGECGDVGIQGTDTSLCGS